MMSLVTTVLYIFDKTNVLFFHFQTMDLHPSALELANSKLVQLCSDESSDLVIKAPNIIQFKICSFIYLLKY
jgi:hypothetical protein